MLISNKVYTYMKFITQILLPALGTLYFTLSRIWGFPLGEEIVGTIVAIDTCLGVILHISTNAYNKSDSKFDGTMEVAEGKDKTIVTMELNKHPNELIGMDEVTFKVNSTPQGLHRI